MKKTIRYITAMTALMLMWLMGVQDASAAVYTWSRYDLSFETPDGGFVTYNTPTRFEIQWEDMVMTVQLYSQDKGGEIVEDMIKSFAENKTQQPNHERKHQKVQPKHKADKEKQKKQEPARPARKEKLYDA